MRSARYNIPLSIIRLEKLYLSQDGQFRSHDEDDDENDVDSYLVCSCVNYACGLTTDIDERVRTADISGPDTICTNVNETYNYLSARIQ